MSRWYRHEAEVWPLVMEGQQRPLDPKVAEMDLRWLAYHGGGIPPGDELATRWGWFSRTGKPSRKRVRLLVAREAWKDEREEAYLKRAGASEGPEQGHARATDQQANLDRIEGKGHARASEGPAKGDTRVVIHPTPTPNTHSDLSEGVPVSAEDTPDTSGNQGEGSTHATGPSTTEVLLGEPGGIPLEAISEASATGKVPSSTVAETPVAEPPPTPSPSPEAAVSSFPGPGDGQGQGGLFPGLAADTEPPVSRWVDKAHVPDAWTVAASVWLTVTAPAMGRRTYGITRAHGQGLELAHKLKRYGTDVVIGALLSVAYCTKRKSTPEYWRSTGGRSLTVILQDQFVEELAALPYQVPGAEPAPSPSPQMAQDRHQTAEEARALAEALQIQAERAAARERALTAQREKIRKALEAAGLEPDGRPVGEPPRLRVVQGGAR